MDEGDLGFLDSFTCAKTQEWQEEERSQFRGREPRAFPQASLGTRHMQEGAGGSQAGRALLEAKPRARNLHFIW